MTCSLSSVTVLSHTTLAHEQKCICLLPAKRSSRKFNYIHKFSIYFQAFVKRLLQVCCYQQPQFTCGALILLSEVLKDRPGLITLSHVEEVSFLPFSLLDEV